jgi:hypothetical protein
MDALLDDRGLLLLLELAPDALHHVGSDGAHVIAHVGNARRLQKGY